MFRFTRLPRLTGALTLAAGLILLAAPARHAAAHQHGAAGNAVELGTSAAADRQGRLWAVSGESAADGGPQVVLRRSDDLGRTWSAPRPVAHEAVTARGEERPKIAFGPDGALYVLYTSPAADSDNPHIGDIRFVRSTDGGATFSEPVTVHADRARIAHAFGSMIVDAQGLIYVAWIDSRHRAPAKARGGPYAGNALYYAVSADGGATFQGDYRIADNTCECCRVALALNARGRPVALWRHVFAPNVRDHALAELAPDGHAGTPARATFDDWRIDACPHHGPSLSYAADGARHQVWFNGKAGDGGGVRYAAVRGAARPRGAQAIGSAQAAHADVLAQGRRIAIAWKDFDGNATLVRARLSADGGRSWRETRLGATGGDSDEPYLIAAPAGMLLLWHTRDEGVRVFPVFADAP